MGRNVDLIFCGPKINTCGRKSNGPKIEIFCPKIEIFCPKIEIFCPKIEIFGQESKSWPMTKIAVQNSVWLARIKIEILIRNRNFFWTKFRQNVTFRAGKNILFRWKLVLKIVVRISSINEHKILDLSYFRYFRILSLKSFPIRFFVRLNRNIINISIEYFRNKQNIYKFFDKDRKKTCKPNFCGLVLQIAVHILVLFKFYHILAIFAVFTNSSLSYCFILLSYYFFGFRYKKVPLGIRVRPVEWRRF